MIFFPIIRILIILMRMYAMKTDIVSYYIWKYSTEQKLSNQKQN